MLSCEASAKAQAIAKQVLAELGKSLTADDTKRSIALRAQNLLSQYGVADTWYYDCPALALLGLRSCLSVSGRDYRPAEEAVGRSNVVTVDLSPLLNGAWGDCARTFIVEDGRPTTEPRTPEFARGLAATLSLHQALKDVAAPDMTFHDLHREMSARILSAGFQNLDFGGNLGHTIADQLANRHYLEPGNHVRLIEAGMFTFEPHIRAAGGRWGFKHENIYYLTAAGLAPEL